MKQELIFFPLPAIGHLVPMVQLAKLMSSRDLDLSINILIFSMPFDSNVNSYIQSLFSETIEGLQFIQLPQAEFLSKAVNPLDLQSQFIASQKPKVTDFFAKLKKSGSSRLAGFIVDFMCTAMIDIANEFEVPSYVFYASGAAILGLSIHVLSLIDDGNQDMTQYMDSETEFSVSSYINPVPVQLLPLSMLHKDGHSMKTARRLITETKGIIVNTFLDLESYAIKSLLNNQKMPPVYHTGLHINFTSVNTSQQDTDTIMRWLDDQPSSSVVYLSFGSFGCFYGEQVKEIAKAIENSGCRFLWSLRRPPPKGRLEYPSEYDNFEEVLPEGFLQHTARVGKVIGWAPQVQVLAHAAVGGFVSHCGWNSVLESVWFGVPMAVWPMYAEQQMNAFLAVKELGIAVDIKMDYKKDIIEGTEVIVKAEEIEHGIRQLMQPEGEIKKKVKQLMEKARTALVEGGSSYNSLGDLIQDFKG